MKNIINLMLFILSGCATIETTFQRKIASNDFKLCFIGDTGTNDPAQLKVAELLRQEKCHSIHFLGDLIYNKGLKNHNDKQFKSKFWDYYGQLSRQDYQPKLNIILGNHDHEGSIDAWMRLSDKYPAVFYPYPFYLLKLNDVCLTHFDTNYYRFFSNFIMEISQNNFLKSIKHEVKKCRVKIALAHHPFFSKGKSRGTIDGIIRFELSESIIGQYDYYISGHDHILADQGVVQKTRILVSGAGGRSEKNASPGFLVMNFKGKDVTYEFRKVSTE